MMSGNPKARPRRLSDTSVFLRTGVTKKAWCGKRLRLGLSGGNGCMRMMGKCKNDGRSAPYGPGGSAGPDENAF